MKTLTPILAVGLALFSQVSAAEPSKPAKSSVTLTVKRHLIDSDRDQGFRSKSHEKTITLRVDIQNATSSTIEGAVLSGDALVTRSIDEHDKVVKERLGTLKVPTLKPNEKLTLDFGEIKLSEVVWKHRKFEETLEEWKVVCKNGETELGQNLSNARYTTLEKEVVPKETHPNRPDGPRPGKFHKFAK
ncbi:MAG: hypothetical protein WCS43_04515 [Verrucomicrobiota bacterium]